MHKSAQSVVSTLCAMPSTAEREDAKQQELEQLLLMACNTGEVLSETVDYECFERHVRQQARCCARRSHQQDGSGRLLDNSSRVAIGGRKRRSRCSVVSAIHSRGCVVDAVLSQQFIDEDAL